MKKKVSRDQSPIAVSQQLGDDIRDMMVRDMSPLRKKGYSLVNPPSPWHTTVIELEPEQEPIEQEAVLMDVYRNLNDVRESQDKLTDELHKVLSMVLKAKQFLFGLDPLVSGALKSGRASRETKGLITEMVNYSNDCHWSNKAGADTVKDIQRELHYLFNRLGVLTDTDT